MTKCNKINLNGVFVPIITPFESNTENVEFNYLIENIRKLNSTKVSGYMPLGSNGEFKSISDDEALSTIKVIRENMSSDKILLAGTGRESSKSTIEFTKKAADLGIDAAFVLTPHYFANKMDDSALIKFYYTVADQSPVSLMIYSAPGFASNVSISPNAVHELSQHENIIGMKDTSNLDISSYIKASSKANQFSVLAGSLNKFLKALKLGATGGVLSAANFMPDLCCKLYELYVHGESLKADNLSDLLIKLNKEVSGKYGVPGVKTAMNLTGYHGGMPRSPLCGLEECHINELKEILFNGINEMENITNK